jgi:uncharacterized protein YecE (DUF72 family)
MHGRNASTWEKKGLAAASDRFNYDYPDEELKEIANHIKVLSRKVADGARAAQQQLSRSGVKATT